MTCELKDYISKLAKTKAPGPKTTFTVFHLFYSLELLSQKKVGRNKLAEKLHVGEGAIRTIISRLVEAELITTSKEGCALTEKGKSVWKEFEEAFPKRISVERNELATSDYNFAFLIKDCGLKVGSGIDQRDAAIVAGARRAIVIVSRNGHLSIESVSQNIEEQFPRASEQILRDFAPQNNDVIVIAGSSDSLLKAKRGAFAAAWSLLKGEKKMPH